MGNWLVNHWVSVLLMVVWLGLNVFLFVDTFLIYEKSDKYYYTRQILGMGLVFARASAICLNFNSMLILIPVCRNLLSFLRGTCSFCSHTLRKPLDHNLTSHKLVAYMICILTAIHIIAHLFNFEYYSRSQQAMDGSLVSVLSSLFHHEKAGDSWLNPIQSPNTTVLYAALTSIAGLTGMFITIVLILMVTSAMEFIRRNYFELFWYTHHLFIIYIVCLGLHGLGGIVRSQTEESMGENHLHDCSESYQKWDIHESKCKHPHFEGHPPVSWKWILAPIALYIFERILHFYRSQQKVVITKVVMHPSKVLELQMNKRGFSMEVGQIEVDGPFSTVSEDVFQYEVAVLIGAGIGVTPFASILKSIWYKFQHEDHKLKTQKIYFYWICRETGAFAWFNHLLISLEQEMEELGKAGHAAFNFDKTTDILTGLKQKTFFGRPMWDNEFSAIAAAYPKPRFLHCTFAPFLANQERSCSLPVGTVFSLFMAADYVSGLWWVFSYVALGLWQRACANAVTDTRVWILGRFDSTSTKNISELYE